MRSRSPLRAILLWACALAVANGLAVGGVGTPVALAAAAPPRAAVARMGLMDFLGNLLYDKEVSTSRRRKGDRDAAGSEALSRLKVVLAHDRTGIDQLTMAKIRVEIQAVVAKYVIIDEDAVQFDLANDDQLTLVTATFPLRGARPRPAPDAA